MIHITNVGSNFDQVQADALNVDEPEHIGPCVRSVIVPECKQGDSKDERRNSTRASQQTERYVEQQSSVCARYAPAFESSINAFYRRRGRVSLVFNATLRVTAVASSRIMNKHIRKKLNHRHQTM